MNAPHVEQFLTLQEIVAAARANLAPGPWSYLMGGAETETTVKRNRHALDAVAVGLVHEDDRELVLGVALDFGRACCVT